MSLSIALFMLKALFALVIARFSDHPDDLYYCDLFLFRYEANGKLNMTHVHEKFVEYFSSEEFTQGLRSRRNAENGAESGKGHETKNRAGAGTEPSVNKTSAGVEGSGGGNHTMGSGGVNDTIGVGHETGNATEPPAESGSGSGLGSGHGKEGSGSGDIPEEPGEGSGIGGHGTGIMDDLESPIVRYPKGSINICRKQSGGDSAGIGHGTGHSGRVPSFEEFVGVGWDNLSA